MEVNVKGTTMWRGTLIGCGFAVTALAAIAATAGEAGPAADPAAAAFEPRTYTDAKGEALPYRLLKPENYDPKQKYPLVIFFHGAGERGTDNVAQLKHCVTTFVKPDVRAKHPCFVLVPQCPPNQKWVDMDWSGEKGTQPAAPSPSMRKALELIEALQKEFSIDAKRLYVSGISMGGYATWDILCRKPEMFAAGIPICGGGDDTKAAAMAKIPVWAFHGDEDKSVKVDRTRAMIHAIKDAGGNPKYTEYKGVGHDSWTKAYAEPELLSWLFAQHRP
jgi:predicted peptidase